MKRLLFIITFMYFGIINAQNIGVKNYNVQQKYKLISNNFRLSNGGYQQIQNNTNLYDSIYNWKLDTSTMGWKVTSKSINYIYDSLGNNTSYLSQNWNGTSWLTTWQYFYTYDSLNNVTGEFYKSWNGSSWGNYDTLSIYAYIYDANDNIMRMAGSNGVDTFTYDNHNNMTSDLNEGNGEWFYSYDVNNNLINASSSVFDSQNNSWDDMVKMMFTYNVNNELIHLLQVNGTTYSYESQGINYTYDSNGNVINYLWQDWYNGNWVNATLYNYTYYANTLKKSFAYKNFNSSSFNNLGGTRIIDGDSMVYYYHSPAGIKQLSQNDNYINIYPNPSNGIIQITTNNMQVTEVNVYDVNGRIVPTYFDKLSTGSNPSQREGNSITIDASSLQNGIYNVCIITNEGITNKRVVIVH